MAGESQREPITGAPDPSVLTTEQMLRAVANLEKQTKTARVGAIGVIEVKIEAIRREASLLEMHRLELKADSEKALSTAMIAAEKAVQAALAAAEKARDQQTIASQLATTKSDDASKEQLKQQGETFTLAIAGLTSSVQDMKGMIGELRAEKRGGKEMTSALYAFAGFVAAIVLITGAFLAYKP